MPKKNLDILTLIVLTHGSKERGITLSEIVAKSDGNLSRSTAHRLLKNTPGFQIAKTPVYPKAYYYDGRYPGIREEQITIQNVFGKIEPIKEPPPDTELRTVISGMIASEEHILETIDRGLKTIRSIALAVEEGKIKEATSNKATMKNLIRCRNALYTTFKVMDLILTDESMSTPEWFRNFNGVISKDE